MLNLEVIQTHHTFLVAHIKHTEVMAGYENLEDIGVFMLGRHANDYRLYVRGRGYDWCTLMSCDGIVEHLIYLKDMDGVLYEDCEYGKIR